VPSIPVVSPSAFDDVRTAALRIMDRRYDLIHQIRREPVKSMGLAFGAGLFVGLIAAVAMPTCRHPGAAAVK